jgi:hypothetical protein
LDGDHEYGGAHDVDDGGCGGEVDAESAVQTPSILKRNDQSIHLHLTHRPKTIPKV